MPICMWLHPFSSTLLNSFMGPNEANLQEEIGPTPPPVTVFASVLESWETPIRFRGLLQSNWSAGWTTRFIYARGPGFVPTTTVSSEHCQVCPRKDLCLFGGCPESNPGPLFPLVKHVSLSEHIPDHSCYKIYQSPPCKQALPRHQKPSHQTYKLVGTKMV